MIQKLGMLYHQEHKVGMQLGRGNATPVLNIYSDMLVYNGLGFRNRVQHRAYGDREQNGP